MRHIYNIIYKQSPKTLLKRAQSDDSTTQIGIIINKLKTINEDVINSSSLELPESQLIYTRPNSIQIQRIR